MNDKSITSADELFIEYLCACGLSLEDARDLYKQCKQHYNNSI